MWGESNYFFLTFYIYYIIYLMNYQIFTFNFPAFENLIFGAWCAGTFQSQTRYRQVIFTHQGQPHPRRWLSVSRTVYYTIQYYFDVPLPLAKPIGLFQPVGLTYPTYSFLSYPYSYPQCLFAYPYHLLLTSFAYYLPLLLLLYSNTMKLGLQLYFVCGRASCVRHLPTPCPTPTSRNII